MTKWYASKTLWFNVLALVALVAGSFGYTGELPGEVSLFVPAIVAIINLVLRFVTKTPVEL